MSILTYSIALIFWNSSFAQDSNAGFKAFCVVPRRKCQVRKLVKQTKIIDPSFNEKTALGTWQVKTLFCKSVSLFMPIIDSTKARGSVQSLSTPRAYTICIEVGFYDFVFWMLQKFLQSCCGVETEKNLLIPKPELSSLQVSFQRSFRFPSVTITLREVKLVSRNEERISFDQ